MQMFLIRHAQSENNARAQSQRVSDPGLTRIGHQQAKRLAERVANLQLTRIITSPFLRAMQTAEYLEQTTGLAPDVRIAIHEKGGCVAGAHKDDMTGRSGMSGCEIAARFPNYHISPEIDGEGWWGCRPLETLEQAIRRAGQVFADTCAEFGESDERVAFVMHGDFLMLFLNRFHPHALNLAWNASLSQVAIVGGSAELVDYSCVRHLPNYLVTW